MAGIVALAISYVLSQFYRSFLAVLTPALSVDLAMTKTDLSLASGAYFFAFAFAQFGVGVSLDRYGPRYTAAILHAAGAGLGAMLFAAATAPWMITLAMALIGLGCAPVMMALLVIFARTFSPARFAVLASWMVAFGTAGNVIGAAPLAAAAGAFGWRPVMAALGVITVLVALSIVLLVRDPARSQEQSGKTGLSGYLELLRMPVLWAIIPLTAINYAPVSGIRGLWAGPYLADLYGADAMMIGRVTLFMALAMVAGALAYGPLDVWFGTRKWVAVGGNAVSLAALVFLAWQPAPSLVVASLLLMVIGVAGGSYGLLMAHARAFVPARLTGRGVTLMNFFAIGGVGAMQFATGAVVGSTAVAGDPAAAYSALFGFYALLLAAALAIYLFARDAPPETHLRSAVD
ncbi:MAG: MFS transporter [Rhizobiaceae bacterium]|nr:MFS transporter [Rhizobiaceae bacterium]